jgi:hypothetical protein
MAKRKARRRRTTSEKVMLVLGILIALSMLVSLIAGLGGGSDPTGNSPLPESERFEAPVEPIGALDSAPLPLAMASPSTTGPPALG